MKNKEKIPSSFSLMNWLKPIYYERYKYINLNNKSKIEKRASDKVALMIRHLSKQSSLTSYDYLSNLYYLNLSKKEGESASVDLMVRHLSDKQGSLTRIPGSIPGAGASIFFSLGTTK